MSAADTFLYSGVSWATNADAVQGGERPGRTAAEHGEAALGRRRKADRQVQQRALAGAVRTNQRGHVSFGNGERALAQRPSAAVALAQAGCLDDVHATPSVSPSAAPPRVRRPAAALIEIPQLTGDERHDPVLVQPRRICLGQPAVQGTPKPGQLWERDLAEGGQDERALAGPPDDEALGLELAVGLGHRVRVDGQRGDHVPDLGQLVAGLEVAETQGVLDLVDELQVGRHARGGVEPELDRRHRRCPRQGMRPLGPCCLVLLS